ncbi:MAG: hypothetical protein H7Z75_19695 [Ferruginibacter sp.]|nr:hypothetical protein [Cytophagales bacterium]
MTNAYTFQQDLNRLSGETRQIICQLAQAYADCTVDSYHYAGLQYAMQLISHLHEIDQYSSAEIVNFMLELELIQPNLDLYHRIYHD